MATKPQNVQKEQRDMIGATFIMPMLAMYQRPKQIDNDALGSVYQNELIASIAEENPTRELLRRAWERVKASWEFGFWPTAQAVCAAIREERKLLPAPKVDPAALRITATDHASPGRIKDVLDTLFGRQLLEAGCGSILVNSYIRPGKVLGPQDLTQDVVDGCVRIQGRFDIAMRTAASEARSSWYLNQCYSLGCAMIEADEKLKAAHIPGYQPRTMERIEWLRGLPYSGGADQLTQHRPEAREIERPPAAPTPQETAREVPRRMMVDDPRPEPPAASYEEAF